MLSPMAQRQVQPLHEFLTSANAESGYRRQKGNRRKSYFIVQWSYTYSTNSYISGLESRIHKMEQYFHHVETLSFFPIGFH